MIKIAGKNREIKAETVLELLLELKINTENMAVVKNGIIIAKKEWGKEKISDCDEIDFLSPVGGG